MDGFAGGRGVAAVVPGAGVPVTREAALAVARVLAAEFAGRAALHDREGSVPVENLARLHEAGLLGLTVPAALGGGAIGLRLACELVGIVAEGCAATALIFAMQLIQQRVLARGAARQGWDEAACARVGRAAVERGCLLNALRVEPELGTPARGGLPATIARRAPDGWRLDGRKIYSTGGEALSWGMVFARTDEAEVRTGPFLVDMRAPGVRIEPSWDQLGLRGSGSHDAVFEDVTVPGAHALELRAPGAWGRPDADGVAWQTLVVAALYTGVARAGRDWLVGFLRARVPANLGAPLATLARMQELVGGIEGLLLANARLVDGAARDADEGAGPSAVQSGLIKVMAAENAIEAVQRAVAATGNRGLSRGEALERHLRDVLCARVHTPQADMAQLAAGRAALGV